MKEKRVFKSNGEELNEKASKYKNKRVILTDTGAILKPEHVKQLRGMGLNPPANSHTFDSELEAEYYRDVLLPRVRSGEIEVKLQPKFVLLKEFTKDAVTYRPITYIPDFLVTYLDGTIEAVDVKGFQNDVFLLKRKLFDAVFPDVKLLILKRVNKYGGWLTVEEYKAHKRREQKEYRSLGTRTAGRVRR